MEFRLLGPLEVVRDGRPLARGGAKQRALLAVLLLHANEVVSRDVLIDALWGEDARTSAEHSLDVQISRLRKALLPGEPLVTRGGGYVLEVDPDSIDAVRFERLLEEGRRANAAGAPAEALARLREALGLWRGRALADIAYESFARPEIERLEESRLSAVEERIDAELALGRHHALVAELESLTAAQPLRERPRAQLMLALYRAGRQAEALRVYADTRRLLVEELGIEPGPELQRLEQAILRQDPSLDLRDGRVRRRTLVSAAALGVAAAVAAGLLLLVRGGTQTSHAQAVAQAESVAVLAARTGRVTAQADARPAAFDSFGAGSLWSVSRDGELTRIDPATGRIVASVGTGVTHPGGLAVGAGSVWITDCCSPTLVRVDPAENVVADRYPLPTPFPYLNTQTGQVAVGAGSVWVAQGFANPSFVERIDPATGRVQHRIRIAEGGAQALAFGDGALWVAGPVLGYLSKIDPRTNTLTATEQALHSWMCCVAAGGGYVWAAISPDHTVWKISDSGKVLTSIRLPAADVENLMYADGAVWVADGEAGTVVRIDAATNAVRTYAIGHHVSGVAVRNGLVAVGVAESAQDVTAGLKGRVLHVALKSDTLDSTDPVAAQTAFNPQQVAFHYATCAKLLNYPDAGGAAGEKLVPEVAAAWPTVTDGGRTYTFRIRRGYRFSPPSNEPVTAESFRHAIERVLSPRIPGPWNFGLLSDVVGAGAYHSAQTPHVAGISVHGDTLVIRLVEPAGDLPARLALPTFCAVPVETPVVPGGVDAPIPSAGPYYLAARGGNVIVLEPNPHYHGPRPHRLDAIVYRFDVDVGDAAAQVASGDVDYVAENDPALSRATAAARGAGGRYGSTSTNWTETLALNTQRPLYSDVRERRATAYAIDRRTLAGRFDVGPDGEAATSRLLPPNLPGPRDDSLRPDPSAARKLVGAQHVHAVLATYADADGKVFDAGFVRALRAELAAIGIEVSVLPIRQTDSPEQQAAEIARADLTRVQRDASTTLDPVDFLASLPLLPPSDQARLARLAAYASPRREAAAASLASQLARDAVYIGLAYSTTPELVSRRVGCEIHQPEYPGLDLAALCLQN